MGQVKFWLTSKKFISHAKVSKKLEFHAEAFNVGIPRHHKSYLYYTTACKVYVPLFVLPGNTGNDHIG